MTPVIRFCRLDEIGEVMAFLDAHWVKDHVLSWHRPLIDWQHREPDGRGYSYVIARDGETGPILGILGFISTRHYDPDLAADNVVDLAIWKLRDDVRTGGLGLRLHHFLLTHEPHVGVVSIGIGNRSHDAMYRALGYFTADYEQFYLLDHDRTDFRLARFPHGVPARRTVDGRAALERLDEATIFSATRDLDIGARKDILPRKTPAYFLRRFLQHPVYDYRVHLIRLDGRACGLMASRIASHDGARALRIVDYLGTGALLSDMGPALLNLIRSEGAEYADLWTWGLSGQDAEACGFHRLDADGPVVIPNYFEPFEQANGRIFFAAKPASSVPFMLFRADGDQDRPNRIAR